ncbi:hypothetical protein MM236_05845 [Belliella sp. DSM 107340]|uniref:DUF4350 domain-containing protein n=1 Tax=Belliella calami TaxID=2923436 RepID=A0ABS9ULK1_9BACT|nr:DUF4350 domain-containing protein [Belliella calami]MCH7397499.1 hypothetical protein [Belliella calami]
MIPKSQKIFMGLLAFIILVLLLLQVNMKSSIDWSESFFKLDKIPYGGKVIYDQLSEKIAEERFKEVNVSAYEWLNKEPEEGVFFAFNSFFSSDKSEIEKMLNWVRRGNTLYVSARNFSVPLLDSLDLKVAPLVELANLNERAEVNFTDKRLRREQPFVFDRTTSLDYFSEMDSSKTAVLGTTKFHKSKSSPEPNFVVVKVGEGLVYLHTFPLAFSNYFLLDTATKSYTQGALAYLPNEGKFYYDNYQKIGKSIYSSPLYLFLANPRLKSAYYTIVFMLFLWIVFEGRRRQRSIPIVLPLENQTVAFSETISAMYMEREAYTEISKQQINLFLEYCRTNFRVKFENFDDLDVKDLATRANCPEDKGKETFDFLAAVYTKEKVSKADVMKVNKLIEEFKSYKNGRK